MQALDGLLHGDRVVEPAIHRELFLQLDELRQRLRDGPGDEVVHFCERRLLECAERLRLLCKILLGESLLGTEARALIAHRDRAFKIRGLLELDLQFAELVFVFGKDVAADVRDPFLNLLHLAFRKAWATGNGHALGMDMRGEGDEQEEAFHVGREIECGGA